MTQIGEAIAMAIAQLFGEKYLLAAISEVTFASGIDLWDVQSGPGLSDAATETLLPPSGTPHWRTGGHHYPAVYVRQGGTGETKDVKVKVEWTQVNCDGSAKVKGESSDGAIVIEGDFNISGERSSAEVSCTFTKKPTTVANYSRGVGFTWTVTAAGETADAVGGTPLILFFVDAKPKPVGWSYKKHFLKVIDWATTWANGQQGEAAVRDALWGQFSNGAAARVPHVTGYAYWQTKDCIQDLRRLVANDARARKYGWSCKAIAHTFMECLAVHGIRCVEVIIEAPGGTQMFLVHNWDVDASPVPNWDASPDLYYAGSWIPSDKPPLSTAVATMLKKVLGGAVTTQFLTIDMAKNYGVPAQGQRLAPLHFSNHWIVQVGGRLYDTSYGLTHANDVRPYAGTSLAGWLVSALNDTYISGFVPSPATAGGGWFTTAGSMAYQAHEISRHVLDRTNAASN